MFKRYLVLFIAIFLSQVSAQENLPVSEDVQIEVLTTSLEKNSKAQRLRVDIIFNSVSVDQKLNLKLAGVSCKPVLISASRGDESLWLIQAQSANENEVVLSWQALEESYLQLLPGNWAAPYKLILEIQISMNNVIDLQNIDKTTLDLILVTGGTESLASTTGRGNQISLKNSRE